MSELYPDLVKLIPENHQYFHVDGRRFESLSRVRDCIKVPFDKSIAKQCAGKGEYVGMNEQQVLEQWTKVAKSSTDRGTRIHEALERYEKTGLVLPADEELRPMIIAVAAGYIDYYQVHQEKTLYDEEYEIAGTADHILETTRHKSSILDLDDYKTNERKGIYYESKYKKYLLGPFSHLQDCNYYDYSLQLSCYALMLEKLTGRKIGKLTITFIPPNNPLAFRKIPVVYLKNDAKILFEYYKEQKHIKKEEGILQQKTFVKSGLSNETSVMPTFG